MNFKILLTLTALLMITSLILLATNVYMDVGKLIAFDGKELTFTLAGTNVKIHVPLEKFSKISFDGKTNDGTGLIMKNGVELPYAKIASVRDGVATFDLPFGKLEKVNLSDIAFVNFKKIEKIAPPDPFEFIVHPSAGGEFIGNLTSVKDGVYNFQTPYGELSLPWSQIKNITKGSLPPIEDGMLLYEDVFTKGELTSFDGTYYIVKTSYGKYKIMNGSLVELANGNSKDETNFNSFLILKDGQALSGNMLYSKQKSVIYETPWGKLTVPIDDIVSIKMRKFVGIHIVTKPSSADVKLDGVCLGKTPLRLPLTLSGEHTIVVTKPEYQVLQKKVYALPYMSTILSYTLSYGNIWQKDSPMSVPREYLSAAECKGKIYAIGGYDGENELNTVESYDPKTDRWSRVASMIKARDGMGVVQCCGKIYAFGGWSCSTLDNAEVYDPEKDTWKKIRSLPTARDRLAAATYDEKIYAIGGYDGGELDTVELYDPKRGVWTEVSSMPTPRDALVAVTCGEKIYAIGGADEDNNALDVVEIYDPESDTWSTGSPMPTPRWGLMAVEYAGKIYAIGGRDSDRNSLDVVEIYDPKKDEWTEANSPMPTPRKWGGIAEYKGKIYVIGGEGENFNALNVVEDYVPGTTKQNEKKDKRKKPKLLGSVSGRN